MNLNALSDVRFVEQPVNEIGRKAFELLQAQMQGVQGAGSYLYPTQIITKRKF